MPKLVTNMNTEMAGASRRKNAIDEYMFIFSRPDLMVMRINSYCFEIVLWDATLITSPAEGGIVGQCMMSMPT